MPTDVAGPVPTVPSGLAMLSLALYIMVNRTPHQQAGALPHPSLYISFCTNVYRRRGRPTLRRERGETPQLEVPPSREWWCTRFRALLGAEGKLLATVFARCGGSSLPRSRWSPLASRFVRVACGRHTECASIRVIVRDRWGQRNLT